MFCVGCCCFCFVALGWFQMSGLGLRRVFLFALVVFSSLLSSDSISKSIMALHGGSITGLCSFS